MATYLVLKRIKEDRVSLPGELLVDPPNVDLLMQRGFLVPVPDNYPGVIGAPLHTVAAPPVEEDEEVLLPAEDEEEAAVEEEEVPLPTPAPMPRRAVARPRSTKTTRHHS